MNDAGREDRSFSLGSRPDSALPLGKVSEFATIVCEMIHMAGEVRRTVSVRKRCVLRDVLAIEIELVPIFCLYTILIYM